MMQLGNGKPIRVGILGAGLVTQVVHLPTLTLLDHLYTVIGICDVSQEAVTHSQKKFNVPFGCTNSSELCSRQDIDLIVIASADEYHASQAIEAANNGKAVLIEKPMTLTRQEAKQIEEARIRNNVHICVAYMRRYTTVWGTFLEELDKAGPILFARVFDYPGPNDVFVSQSSTYPKAFVDDVPESAREDKEHRSKKIVETALGAEMKGDARLNTVYRLLGSLGSHDLSCMRHAFGGSPKKCTAAFASLDGQFIAATFIYSQSKGPDYLVNYETGIHRVSTFDAYIEVYCQDKIVRIDYDTPFVKGLPIKVTIRENTGSEGSGYQERVIRPTFVDAYTAEFIRLSKSLREGKLITNAQSTLRHGWNESSEMCSPTDAMADLDVFDMIMDHLRSQNTKS